MPLVRLALAFAAALIVAIVAAGTLHMQVVLAELGGLGVQVSAVDRVRSTLLTIRGFVPTLGPVLAAGLAIGFVVAAVLRRVLRPLAPLGYPLAGAAAMATALTLMRIEYETTPITSAHTPLGFAALCATTAFAGWVFARLRNPASAPSPRRRPAGSANR